MKIEDLINKAKSGDGSAQQELTDYYQKQADGYYKTGSYDDAMKCYKCMYGVDKNDPLAAYMISKIYSLEKYIPTKKVNKNQKVEEWKKKGDDAKKQREDKINKYNKNPTSSCLNKEVLKALYTLGRLYSTSLEDIIEQNYKKAEECYQKILILGKDTAYEEIVIKNLGDLYYEGGHGLQKDYYKAIKCYELLKNKNCDVEYKIGCMYENGGYGLEIDSEKAKEYYVKASEKTSDCSNEFKEHISQSLASLAEKISNKSYNTEQENTYKESSETISSIVEKTDLRENLEENPKNSTGEIEQYSTEHDLEEKSALEDLSCLEHTAAPELKMEVETIPNLLHENNENYIKELIDSIIENMNLTEGWKAGNKTEEESEIGNLIPIEKDGSNATKEIILLCDGTGASPDNNIDDGKNTNVQIFVDLFNSSIKTSADYTENYNEQEGWTIHTGTLKDSKKCRIIYYDRGLGAPRFKQNNNTISWDWREDQRKAVSFIESIKDKYAQFSAVGISENIRLAYKFLVEHFSPGDSIYMFGYSRGAYTIRVLIAFLRYIGLIDKEKVSPNLGNLMSLINEGFDKYRTDLHPDYNIEAIQFRDKYSHKKIKGLINFLGLWDTVRGLVVEKIKEDGKLTSVVLKARHALAIDEQRIPFQPSIWIPPFNDEGIDTEQRWFPGAHGDVGGGYKDRKLANISLLWMAKEVDTIGVELNWEYLRENGYSINPDDNFKGLQTDTLSLKVGCGDLTWEKIGHFLFEKSKYIRPIAITSLDESIDDSALKRFGAEINIDGKEGIPTKYVPENLHKILIAYNNFKKLSEEHKPLWQEKTAGLGEFLEITSNLASKKLAANLQDPDEELAQRLQYEELANQSQIEDESGYEEDNSWFNDDQINFLLKSLGNEHVRVIAAINLYQEEGKTLSSNLEEIQLQQTLEVSINTVIEDTLVMPLNLGQQHWAALYIHFNTEDRTMPMIGYFDPFGHTMPKILELTLKKVYTGIKNSNIITSPIRLQSDGYNCGPWVIAILESLIAKEALPDEDLNIREARRTYLERIKQAKQQERRTCLSQKQQAKTIRDGKQAAEESNHLNNPTSSNVNCLDEQQILAQYKRLINLSRQGDDAYVKAKNSLEDRNEKYASEYFRESKKHYKTILSFYDAKKLSDSICEYALVDIGKLRKRVIKIKMGKEFFQQHKFNCEKCPSYLKDLYTGLKSGTSDKRKWEELKEEFGEDWARDCSQKQNRAKPSVS